METKLFDLLMEYVKEHNPELILNVGKGFSLTVYLSDKVESVRELLLQLKSQGLPALRIEQRCMDELTKDLLPSRADYIRNLLHEEFPDEYKRFADAGILTYEVVNLIEYCGEAFESYEFNLKNQGSRFLRYAVIAQVADYLIDRS